MCGDSYHNGCIVEPPYKEHNWTSLVPFSEEIYCTLGPCPCCRDARYIVSFSQRVIQWEVPLISLARYNTLTMSIKVWIVKQENWTTLQHSQHRLELWNRTPEMYGNVTSYRTRKQIQTRTSVSCSTMTTNAVVCPARHSTLKDLNSPPCNSLTLPVSTARSSHEPVLSFQKEHKGLPALEI